MVPSIIVNEMKHWIKEFDDQRDRHQYCHPKELAISISLEQLSCENYF